MGAEEAGGERGERGQMRRAHTRRPIDKKRRPRAHTGEAPSILFVFDAH